MTHLDTSFLIRALQRGSAQQRQLLAWLGGADPVSISACAWAEFLCGPVSVEVTTLTRELLGEPVPVRRAKAERVAQLFDLSGRCRRSLGDCLVAAAAIEAGARLVTENRRAFDAFTAAGLLLF